MKKQFQFWTKPVSVDQLFDLMFEILGKEKSKIFK